MCHVLLYSLGVCLIAQGIAYEAVPPVVSPEFDKLQEAIAKLDDDILECQKANLEIESSSISFNKHTDLEKRYNVSLKRHAEELKSMSELQLRCKTQQSNITTACNLQLEKCNKNDGSTNLETECLEENELVTQTCDCNALRNNISGLHDDFSRLTLTQEQSRSQHHQAAIELDELIKTKAGELLKLQAQEDPDSRLEELSNTLNKISRERESLTEESKALEQDIVDLQSLTSGLQKNLTNARASLVAAEQHRNSSSQSEKLKTEKLQQELDDAKKVLEQKEQENKELPKLDEIIESKRQVEEKLRRGNDTLLSLDTNYKRILQAYLKLRSKCYNVVYIGG